MFQDDSIRMTAGVSAQLSRSVEPRHQQRCLVRHSCALHGVFRECRDSTLLNNVVFPMMGDPNHPEPPVIGISGKMDPKEPASPLFLGKCEVT